MFFLLFHFAEKDRELLKKNVMVGQNIRPTIGATTLSMKTLSIMTFSITLNEMRQSVQWHLSKIVVILSVVYAEC
jgi:hypothetical protein